MTTSRVPDVAGRDITVEKPEWASKIRVQDWSSGPYTEPGRIEVEPDALVVHGHLPEGYVNAMAPVPSFPEDDGGWLDAPVLDLPSGNPKDRIGDTKPPLHLVPSALTIEAAMAMKNGAEKYGPFNWREHPVRASVYISAALRHLVAYFDGEDVAEDSGRSHLGHAAAGIGILLDAIATGNVIDDRPTPGAAASLLEANTERAA